MLCTPEVHASVKPWSALLLAGATTVLKLSVWWWRSKCGGQTGWSSSAATMRAGRSRRCGCSRRLSPTLLDLHIAIRVLQQPLLSMALLWPDVVRTYDDEEEELLPT
jgi:hypothetical protein